MAYYVAYLLEPRARRNLNVHGRDRPRTEQARIRIGGPNAHDSLFVQSGCAQSGRVLPMP
jgi:hypothetical protein